MKELENAKAAGSVEAGIALERYKQMLSGGIAPEAIPPIPNTTGTDTNTGLAAKPSKDSLLQSAQAQLALGELDKARVEYQTAFKYYEGDLEVTRGMAALLYRMGSLDEARAFLDSALQRSPQDVDLLRFRANTLERLFDKAAGSKPDLLTQAMTDYSAAVKLAPNHEFLNMEYARAQAKKK